MSLHDEIRSIIQEYYKAPKNGCDVDTLMNMRRRLACLKYGLAAEVGGLYDEKNGAEYRRKAAFAQKRAEAISEGDTAAKAEAKAQEATTEQLKDDLSADAAYKAGNLILEAVKDVLDAMAQHIANLRQEKREEMAGQGSQS